MNLITKQILAFMLMLSLLVPNTARAGIIPVIDPANIAAIMAQIAKASQQISKMASLVGAAKDQINKLKEVSDGIRNLRNVVQGGAQGLLGTVSDQLGLKDVFMVGKELQQTFNQGYELYRDVKSLPDSAKNALKEVGLSVKDVQEYMSEGLVYDAFSGMGIDEWRKVFKNPVDAFVTGSVGRACERSNEYLDTESLQKEYAARLAAMSPEDRARMSGSAGVDMLILNMGSWAKGLEKSIASTVQWGINADKAAEKAGAAENVLDATKVSTAVDLQRQKIEAERARQEALANQQMVNQAAAQTRLMQQRNTATSGKNEAEALSGK